MLVRSPEYEYLGVQSCFADLLTPRVGFGFQGN